MSAICRINDHMNQKLYLESELSTSSIQFILKWELSAVGRRNNHSDRNVHISVSELSSVGREVT